MGAKLAKSNNGFSLPFSEKDAKSLELEAGRNYEIIKARKGLYLLMDSSLLEEEFFRKIDEKIFEMLEKSAIQDRVEQKFERFLSQMELSRFSQLLKEGKVEKFKASEKYKKSVYRRKEEGKKPSAQGRQAGGRGQQGFFASVSSEQQARELNDAHWKELKDGELKGIKDFDNTYYIIDSESLAECEGLIIEELKKAKQAGIEELSKSTGIAQEMIRGVCAFLKEEGEVLEKKRGVYTYIS